MIPISLFNNKYDKVPQSATYSWQELIDLLTRHQSRSNKDYVPAWSPTRYGSVNRRCKENVEQVSCLALDFDDGIEFQHYKRGWSPYAYLVYSSFSHTVGHPKFRAVFPLADFVHAEDWPEVYPKLANEFGKGTFDPACSNADRIYFLPACPPERQEQKFVYVNDGEWIDHRNVREVDITIPPEAIVQASTGKKTSGVFSTVDYRAIAYAQLPRGGRHTELIRAIFRARKENWDKEAIDILIRSFHDNEKDFYPRTQQRSLAYYLGVIDKTWCQHQPDPRYAEKGAVVV